MFMKHSSFMWICLSTAVACLMSAYALGARWEAALAFLGCLFLCLLLGRRRYSWLPYILLLLYSFASAYGVLVGLNPWLLAVGMCAALGTWEITLFMQSSRGETQSDYVLRMEKNHLHLLAGVLLLSMLLSLSGMVVRLNLPFLAVVLIVLAALLSIRRLVLLLQNS
jgi:hypothetical protein